MASESFDVTDDNGINVTGTVDVFRDRKGKFFDPTSEYYKKPRYAEAHFEYFNTREACTIDRKVLSKAMQQAFTKALEKFGISGPDAGKVEADVNASINATRQQCIQNADKYVSNETFSSTNWETGKAVGSLTAKAYAAVPTPGGDIQTVVARENSWPADDVSAFKNDDSTNARNLSGRVIDGNANVFENWSHLQVRGSDDALSPVLRALAKYRNSAAPDESASAAALPRPAASNAPGSGFGSQVTAGNKAVPVLTRVGKSIGDSLTPAEGASPPGPLLRDRTVPNLPGEEMQEIISEKPERRLSRRIVNPSASASQGTVLAMPFSPLNEVHSLDDRASFGDRFGNWTSPSESIPPFNPNLAVATPEPSQPPSTSSGVAGLNRNKPQASAFGPTAPFDASDPHALGGGLLGRYVALAGLDPENPSEPALPPLDDEQERASLQALDAKLSSTGDIRDAVALYKARKASQR
jgi:hypothetical protein